MTELRVITNEGTDSVLEGSIVEGLRSGLRGELVLPDDADYDEVRTVHNAMIDERPALIARCANVADVIAAVNFGRDNELLLAIRSHY